VSRADIGSPTVSEAGINRLSPSGRALLQDRKPASPDRAVERHMARESFHEGEDSRRYRGTSGIGEVAAEKLAEMGARIVLVARDRSRGEGTLARLREKAPGLTHTVHYADLTRISEMKRVAAEVAEAEPRIDVLVNNAGAMFSTRKLTEDGLEYRSRSITWPISS
jgi:hypothetical protein